MEDRQDEALTNKTKAKYQPNIRKIHQKKNNEKHNIENGVYC